MKTAEQIQREYDAFCEEVRLKAIKIAAKCGANLTHDAGRVAMELAGMAGMRRQALQMADEAGADYDLSTLQIASNPAPGE
jgi:hypothetical protein